MCVALLICRVFGHSSQLTNYMVDLRYRTPRSTYLGDISHPMLESRWSVDNFNNQMQFINMSIANICLKGMCKHLSYLVISCNLTKLYKISILSGAFPPISHSPIGVCPQNRRFETVSKKAILVFQWHNSISSWYSSTESQKASACDLSCWVHRCRPVDKSQELHGNQSAQTLRLYLIHIIYI